MKWKGLANFLGSFISIRGLTSWLLLSRFFTLSSTQPNLERAIFYAKELTSNTPEIFPELSFTNPVFVSPKKGEPDYLQPENGIYFDSYKMGEFTPRAYQIILKQTNYYLEEYLTNSKKNKNFPQKANESFKSLMQAIEVFLSIGQHTTYNYNNLLYRKAFLLSLQGKEKKALAIFEWIFKVNNPDNIHYLYPYLKLLVKHHHYKQAHEVLEKSIKRDIENLTTLKFYLEVSLYNNNLTESQKFIDEIISDKLEAKKIVESGLFVLQITNAIISGFYNDVLFYIKVANNHLTQRVLTKVDRENFLEILCYAQNFLEVYRNNNELTENQRDYNVKMREGINKNLIKYFEKLEKKQTLDNREKQVENLKANFNKLRKLRQHFFRVKIPEWERNSLIEELLKDPDNRENIIKYSAWVKAGEEMLPGLRIFSELNQNHATLFQTLYDQTRLYVALNNYPAAASALQERWSFPGPFSSDEMTLAYDVFKHHNLFQDLEKILKYRKSLQPQSVYWNLRLIEHYILYKPEEALFAIKQARKTNPHSFVLAKKELEYYVLNKDAKALTTEFDRILNDPLLFLNESCLCELHLFVYAFLENFQDPTHNLTEVMDYGFWLRTKYSLEFKVYFDIEKKRIDELLTRGGESTDYRGSLITGSILMAVPLLYGWNVYSRNKKKENRKKNQLKILQEYLTAFKKYNLSVNEVPESINRKNVKTDSPQPGPSLGVLLSATNGSVLPTKKINRPDMSSNPEQAIPSLDSGQTTTTIINSDAHYEWEDPNIPVYNKDSEKLFIPVTKIHNARPSIPTFFFVTLDVLNEVENNQFEAAFDNDDISDNKSYAARLYNKLKERPEIGHEPICRRTYKNLETNNRILKYKIRIRLKRNDGGFFAREEVAYDASRKKIIAKVLIFDVMKNHDDETRDMLNGNGVGELISRNNRPEPIAQQPAQINPATRVR